MLIEKEIETFIKNEENNGALLITGKWGCGKSYLVKQCVNDINSRNVYAIAVISLFGIDCIAALNAKVRDAYLELTSGIFGKKAQRIFRVLKKVANDSANITAAALPESTAASAISMGVSSVLSFNPLNFIAVKKTVGQGDNQREFALVFDDFERCNIAKKDLMGAINEYAENKDIKVIIVADEEKIKDDEYSEFKEKVVARTLKMSSDYPKIITSIIENYRTSNKDYKEFILKNKSCIITAYKQSGYDNLRTLKSCLIDFERIFEAWIQTKVSRDTLKDTFYKFCAITYEAKSSHYSVGPYEMYTITVDEQDPQKRDAAIEGIKSKYTEGAFTYTLNSISKWIVSGEWNKEAFQAELKRKYLREELSYEDKFLQYNFWDLEQTDIEQGMPLLVARAYNGEVSRDELLELLKKVHALKTYRISLPCEVDYQKLNQGFELHSEKVKCGSMIEPKRRTFVENNQIDDEAITLNEKIEKFDDYMHAWENRRQFISYLQAKGDVSYYSLKNICVQAFDDELYRLFIEKYMASTNGEKRELCWAILGIDFNNPYYSTLEDRKTTLKNYNTLISKLKELSEADGNSLRAAIHKSFIERLKECISKLSISDNL